MKSSIHSSSNSTASKCKLLAATCSSLLLGGLTIAAPAFAQLNPRPSIFNEPPYNRTRPIATPPATTSPATTPPITTSPTTTPAPSSTEEPEQIPEVTIAPTNGVVSVTLNNQTAAPIRYQVIGDTEPRTLAGRSQILLQSLRLPMTLTFRREDGGLLQPVLLPGSAEGTLDLNLSEATDLSVDRLTLVVDQAGQAFLR